MYTSENNTLDLVVPDGEDEPTYNAQHIVTLNRTAKRSLNNDKLAQSLDVLVARLSTTGRVQRGWHFTYGTITVDVFNTDVERKFKYRAPAGEKSYTVEFHLDNTGKARTEQSLDAEFRTMVSVLVSASNAKNGWDVVAVDGTEWVDAEADLILKSGDADFVGYAACEVPGNWRDYVAHIYERDAQIEWIMTSLTAAADSDWENRFNGVFVGPPACGKTEVGLSLVKMLGEDAVLRFDGTALTAAGFIKALTERETRPRVIFIEEIEKADEAALRPVLGVADTRGQIRKNTARADIERDTRCIVIATCNDYEALKGMLKGALASRLNEPIWFPRPDRKLMRKILLREIAKVNGDTAWVEPVLDYCQKRDINDPRKAIAFCLRGRDGWLNGKTETTLETIRRVGDEVGK